MRRHKILLGVVAGLLMVGAVVGGVALAQDPATPTPNPTPRFGFGRGGMMGRMWGKGGGGAGGGASLVSTAANALNVPVADLLTELGQGKTLNQVITEHKGDAKAIVDKFVAEHKAVLDQAVKDGRLVQAQEDLMLKNMTDQAAAQLDQPGTAFGGGKGRGFGGMLGFGRRGLGDGSGLLGVVADTLKMTPADVMAEWAKGKTLRQLIIDHQGDPSVMVDKVVADRKAGLDQAVTAGSLTQDQENVVLQNLKTQLNAELDLLGMNMPEVPGMRRGGRGGMMGGWGRGLQFNPGRLFRFGTQSS